jgi:quinolinate synthase
MTKNNIKQLEKDYAILRNEMIDIEFYEMRETLDRLKQSLEELKATEIVINNEMISNHRKAFHKIIGLRK